MQHLNRTVFRQLVSRAIRRDYLENLTGFAWLIIQPLLLLAVYAFVFTTIFKARIVGMDANEAGRLIRMIDRLSLAAFNRTEAVLPPALEAEYELNHRADTQE